jgi:hypothetical protein
MIDAGHLAPGLSLFEQHYRYDNGKLGWQLDDYWHNPADLVYTLAVAIPHLPDELREPARAYLRSEFERYPPYDYIHMGPGGARREHFSLPAEFGSEWPQSYGQEPTAVTEAHWEGWSFNPFNAYACLKYAEIFPDQAEPLLIRLRNKIGEYPSRLAFLETHPHVLNVYIAGYFGYLGLQNLVGEARSASVEELLARALQTRLDILQNDPRELNGSEAGGFMWLVPELGDYLHQHARERVEEIVSYQSWAAPYWFIANAAEVTRYDSERDFMEGYHSHIYEYMSGFQVRAFALKWPRAWLEKYLDVRAVYRGDLYFIQNLCATLDASEEDEAARRLEMSDPPYRTPRGASPQTGRPR